jgi:hypothetical protein
MKLWWPRVISNENLWEMSGQININMKISKLKFGWIGHTLLRMIVNCARQLCSGIHKVQEIHGDELH